MNLREYLASENYDVLGKEVYVTCCNISGITGLRNIKPTKMSVQLNQTSKQIKAHEFLLENIDNVDEIEKLDLEAMFKFSKIKENGRLFSKNSWISYLGKTSTYNNLNALHIFTSLEEAQEMYIKESEKCLKKLNESKKILSSTIDEKINEIKDDTGLSDTEIKELISSN